MDRSSTAGRPVATAAGIRCQVDIDVHGRFGWRMVAVNGRSMAVSLTSYDTDARCRAGFLRLCGGHADLGGGIQHSAEGSGWVWVLWDAAGRRLARSARTYERHATCRTAYDRFRALLPELAMAGPELWAHP